MRVFDKPEIFHILSCISTKISIVLIFNPPILHDFAAPMSRVLGSTASGVELHVAGRWVHTHVPQGLRFPQVPAPSGVSADSGCFAGVRYSGVDESQCHSHRCVVL